MDFKSEQKNLTFSDLEKSFKDEKNRSLKTLMDLEKTISWDRIESILLKDYPVGNKREGNRAYSPLFLFKCLLLQKWFRINSELWIERACIGWCKVWLCSYNSFKSCLCAWYKLFYILHAIQPTHQARHGDCLCG